MENLNDSLDAVLQETNALLDIEVKGKDIEVNEETEKVIAKLLMIKRLVKEAEANLNTKLKELSKKNPQKAAYEGEMIKLVVSPRTSYEVNELTDEMFCEFEKKPNNEKIEAYIKLTGHIPPSVTQRTSLSITKKLL